MVDLTFGIIIIYGIPVVSTNQHAQYDAMRLGILYQRSLMDHSLCLFSDYLVFI